MGDSGYWYSQNQASVRMGHSAAFVFTNKLDGSNNSKTTSIKNIETIGNIGSALDIKVEKDDSSTTTEKDPNQAKIDDAAGGLIFLKSNFGLTSIDNFIIKNYQIALFPSGEYSNKTMVAGNGRIYDCFNSAVFSYCSTENEFKNCTFKRFGGPALFLNSNQVTRDSKKYIGATSIKLDKDCEVENYVDGTEPWFAINGATELATQVRSSFELLMNSYAASIVYKFKNEKDETKPITKMNLVLAGLDNGFLNATVPTRVGCEIEGYTPFSTFDAQTKGSTNQTFTSTASEIRTTFPNVSKLAPIVRCVNKDQTKDVLGSVYQKQSDSDTTPQGLYKADGFDLSSYHMPYTDGTSLLPNGNILTGDYLQLFYPMGTTEIAMILTMHPYK